LFLCTFNSTFSIFHKVIVATSNYEYDLKLFWFIFSWLAEKCTYIIEKDTLILIKTITFFYKLFYYQIEEIYIMKKNQKVPIANMDSHENGEKQLLAAWVDD